MIDPAEYTGGARLRTHKTKPGRRGPGTKPAIGREALFLRRAGRELAVPGRGDARDVVVLGQGRELLVELVESVAV